MPLKSWEEFAEEVADDLNIGKVITKKIYTDYWNWAIKLAAKDADFKIKGLGRALRIDNVANKGRRHRNKKYTYETLKEFRKAEIAENKLNDLQYEIGQYKKKDK